VIVEPVDDQGWARLRVRGELDLSTAADLLDALNESAPQAPVVTVDLGEVTFIDSAGLRALLSLRGEPVADPPRRVRLVAISDRDLGLLELCGVLGAFEVEPAAP